MKKEKLMTEMETEFEARYSSSTAQTYLYSINRFVERFPNAKRLKLSQIESYFMELKIQGDSVGYRNTTLASIKAYYNFLLEVGEISEHPCSTYHLDEKRTTGKDFSSLLSMEEMELLLTLKEERFSHLGNKNKAIIGLLIYQGLTSKELVELKVKDIDLDNGIVHIKGFGKNKNRSISLKPSQINFLIRYIESDRKHLLKSDTKTLFISMRGVGMSVDGLHSFIEKFDGAFDKVISPMNIRNSVISHWLNVRKFPLEDVQVMAGHRYPSSTEKYIHPDVQEQREAVTRLHNSIFG